MTRPLVFAAYDSATGLPLPGLTPVWAVYYDASTGADASPGPAVTELGLGLYQTTIGDNEMGAILLGTTSGGATPQAPFLGVPSLNVPSFIAVDTSGNPLRGDAPDNTPVWYITGGTACCYDTTTRLPVASPPSIVTIAHGLFAIPALGSAVAGIIDCGPLAQRRYLMIGLPDGGNSIAPSVGNFSPAPGSTIAPADAIGFDVTDAANQLRAVVLMAEFPGSVVKEVVYDGSAFAALYAAHSSVSSIANGLRFSLVRGGGGWPGSPTITPVAVDASGNEAP